MSTFAGMTKPAVVYMHRDNDGRVLYIGATTNLALRNRQHAARADWWTRVVSVAVESEHPTWHAAHAREAALIAEHEPRYNQRHNTDAVHRGHRTPEEWSAHRAACVEAASAPVVA